jgi:hypothetical protein
LIQKPGREVPESKFKKAYDFFLRRLKDEDEEGNPRDAKRILEIVKSRLTVVMINLSDSDDPYLIFESLNFKGAPLEQADLVRNYFLMRFEITEQQAVYDDLWLPMQNRLGPALTEFMRHFLGSEGEEIRKGDVYAAIKRLVTDSQAPAVRLVMSRMEQQSVFYSRIATIVREPGEELEPFFDRFRRLDFGTAYPLLLSLYEGYTDGQFAMEEFVDSLRILESYIIRRMVVGVPSNSLSGVFITLCRTKPVTENPSAWLSAALSWESKNRRWPTDAEFLERWLKSPIYQSRACPVILESLEEQFGHHETVAFTDATVEHIMPQTLTPEWEQSLGSSAPSIHSEWLHTVGNLTLTGYNPELSNRCFAEKRSLFVLSHFELNRYFGGFESWGGPEIRRRAESLFETARKLWPRPAIVPEETEPATGRARPSNSHGQCVRSAQEHLRVVFSKLSQTRYESGNQGSRLVCAVSTEHDEKGETPYFWFGVHLSQIEFLETSPAAFFCFGCGSPEKTLLVPFPLIKPLLPQMSFSDRHFWHVVVQKRSGKLILRLLGGVDGPDLTGLLVSSQP